MAGPLYSPSWYRVAELRPRLRPHVEIHRQSLRGDVWYVVQDHQTGQFHRLSPAGYFVLGQMDGRRSVDEIWRRACARLGDEQPTQQELVELLAQLHGADLILGDVTPDLAEMDLRAARHQKRTLLSRLRNPLALRLPLLDPDRFLAATLPLVRPLFTHAGFAAWLLLVLAGIVVGAVNFEAFGAGIADQALTAENVLLILLLYPAVKCIHELGHAYATKVWGGEVHEMGVMVLVLMPVPYLDASASTGFRDRRQRMIVGGAGILVELALAALAMIVWALAEPGLLRAVAFNVVLICGVSTLVFNANPLLRFDGYYVLSDLLEIPNLASRANKYVLYLIERHGFGVSEAISPVTAPSERGWLLAYAIASFLYRFAIMLTIALYIATQLFFVGVGLALISVFGAVVWPLLKGIRHLATGASLRGRRRRALAVSAAAAGAMILPLLALPLPHATMAQGIVWVGEQAALRAEADGIVTAIIAHSGARVAAEAPILVAEDRVLAAMLAVQGHQLAELQARLEAVRLTDLVQANLLREQVRNLEGQIAESRRRLAGLELRSARAGLFLASDMTDLPGRLLRRGDVVGYVLGEEDPVVRVVVTQADVDLVRRSTRAITIRFSERIEEALPATLLREVPAAQAELPHLALATSGGGTILLDPMAQDRPRALEPIYQFDLRLPPGAAPPRLGGRVHVRFAHPDEPAGPRLLRAARQVFLRQFGV
ncbi:PqqD family peptide modification chaperone [Rhabdaerophilum calidifontis]|uniref:PqqD family peptide modification chaperone n=1 Tax=Rhabdaerophilum calidifontis TaxID=2604328 RepID=UPI00123C22E6|nr:PqqD family peptide modification chaperone [Rhabdaerophilum calidifontis]